MESHFSIRQVIELTGVSEYVLRAWELRYSALNPKRTDTGRRLYSKNDLEKARALWELTQKGYKISEVAPLSLPQLKKILLEERSPSAQTAHAIPTLIQKILISAEKFDWDYCRETLLKERKKLSLSRYIHEVILPLVQTIGVQVAEQNLSIAQEHILSSFIKENLNALNADRLPKNTSTRIIFASPEGDMHEIGLLIALALVRNSGISTLYLGPNTPKVDLCDTAIRFRATHLLISSTISKTEGAKEDFLKYLNFLDQKLPAHINFWLGGRNIHSLPFSLKRAHKKIESFLELETYIHSKTT